MSIPLLTHFGLKAAPFGRQAPSDALLEHRGFSEARRRIRFTAEMDGFAALVADPGCGKSLLLGVVADALQRADWAVHYFALG